PTVSISSSTGATSTLTITTFGQTTSTRVWNLRMCYAFWLAVPGLALVGARGVRSHRKNLLAVFFLVAIAGSLLLLSACPGPPGTTALNGQRTPNNTYTLTLTGADTNGAAPSNVPPNADVATVTLAVTTVHTAN
ncbi:MAG: hypothetical protein WBE31_02450, partial [Candidatus Sulfotelmatobacter sp.]